MRSLDECACGHVRMVHAHKHDVGSVGRCLARDCKDSDRCRQFTNDPKVTDPCLGSK